MHSFGHKSGYYFKVASANQRVSEKVHQNFESEAFALRQKASHKMRHLLSTFEVQVQHRKCTAKQRRHILVSYEIKFLLKHLGWDVRQNLTSLFDYAPTKPSLRSSKKVVDARHMTTTEQNPRLRSKRVRPALSQENRTLSQNCNWLLSLCGEAPGTKKIDSRGGDWRPLKKTCT